MQSSNASNHPQIAMSVKMNSRILSSMHIVSLDMSAYDNDNL